MNFTDPSLNKSYSLDRGVSLAIDLRYATSKKAVIDACAKGLNLPPHFGSNWDALADCLTDETWAVAPSYLIIVQGAIHAAKALGEHISTLQEILEEAAEFWQEQDKAFIVILSA
jgi:RNAse (barnase) inhibitor barstar